MGTYNRLQTATKCPRCVVLSEAIVDCHFGDTSHMVDLTIGDTYPWRPGKAVQNGGRPDQGNIDGEGYAECPSCRKDFFVKVIVRHDRIGGVETDASRSGYIPD
jgi:hypothetical protein